MKYRIKTTKSFDKALKKLSKKYVSIADDYELLLQELKQNPHLGTQLGHGLRKIRMRIASKGKGKSGGARVISYMVIIAVGETDVNLLYVYDKSERDNITEEELKALLEANGL